MKTEADETIVVRKTHRIFAYLFPEVQTLLRVSLLLLSRI